MYLESVLLYCNKQMQQFRSLSSIYHILRGNKKIQTLHDARLFKLERFFSIYPTLTKSTFSESIKWLADAGFIQEVSNEDNRCQLTTAGIDKLENYQGNHCLDGFNGLKYHKVDDLFFERLQLVIQTYTNLMMNDRSFIPVTNTRQTIQWVKNFYKEKFSVSNEDVLKQLYHDLQHVFHFLTNREVHFLLDQLTGYQAYGMSTHQLSQKYQLNEKDVPLLTTRVIHKMLLLIEQKTTKFYVLPLMIHKLLLKKQHVLTHSAAVTQQLLNKGYAMEEVANKRHLKLHTIYDHVVEIALFVPSFPIEDYVSVAVETEIRQAIMKTQSYKLKDIKVQLPDTINYFEIRLVLTKMHQPLNIHTTNLT